MEPAGFEEHRQPYFSGDPQKLVGQMRRLGDAGPAYEIMEVGKDGTVVIELIYSDERLSYPLAEILADPIAETIP